MAASTPKYCEKVVEIKPAASAASLDYLEFHAVMLLWQPPGSRERLGDGLARMSTSVRNGGGLPTGYSTTGRHPELPGGEVVVRLELSGARLLSGEGTRRLPALGGGSRGEPVEWLLQAPRGTRVSVIAESRFCSRVVKEVGL